MASEAGDLSDSEASEALPCLCTQRRGSMAEVEFRQWLERGVPGYEKKAARRRPATAPIRRLDMAVRNIEKLKDELHLRDRQIMDQRMLVEQRLAVCSNEANIHREKQLKKQTLQKRRWKAELKEMEKRHAQTVSSWQQKIRQAEAEAKCEELCEWDRRRKDMEETARKMRESQFKARMELGDALKKSRSLWAQEAQEKDASSQQMAALPFERLQAKVQEHQEALDQKKRELQESVQEECQKIQVYEAEIAEIRREAREHEVLTKAMKDQLEEKVAEQRMLAQESQRQLKELKELEATKQRLEKEQEMRTEMEQICQDIEKHFKEKVGGCARKTSVEELPNLFKESGDRFGDGSLTYRKVASWIIEQLHEVVDKMKQAENMFSETEADLAVRLEKLMDLWLGLFERIGEDFPKEVTIRLIVYKSEEEDPTCGKMAGVMVRATCGAEIQLLLDQSGSVTKKVWDERLVPAVMRFIDAFGDDLKLKWGAVAYGEVQDIGDKMTGEAMKCVVRNHAYNDGSTPTAEALARAVGKFDPGPLRMIVNFTDGKPNDISRARQQFDEANKKEIIVVGIGIGSINEECLKQMSSPGFVIKVDSFEGLAESLQKAANKVDEAKRQAATCTFDDIKDIMATWKQRVKRGAA